MTKIYTCDNCGATQEFEENEKANWIVVDYPNKGILAFDTTDCLIKFMKECV